MFAQELFPKLRTDSHRPQLASEWLWQERKYLMKTFVKTPLMKTLVFVLYLTLTFAVALFVKARSQDTAPTRRVGLRQINGKSLADKEPVAERTSFTENGPLGRWSASIIPDLSRNSSTSPVVVTGTTMLLGNSQWRNLQLTYVTLKNYSSKTVLGVQLKWFITTKENRSKILPPPGYTGLFEAHLEPGSQSRWKVH